MKSKKVIHNHATSNMHFDAKTDFLNLFINGTRYEIFYRSYEEEPSNHSHCIMVDDDPSPLQFRNGMIFWTHVNPPDKNGQIIEEHHNIPLHSMCSIGNVLDKIMGRKPGGIYFIFQCAQ